MKKKVLMVIVFAMVFTLFGCSKKTPERDLANNVELDESTFNKFVKDLEAKEFEIVSDDVGKDILEGQRKWLYVDGEENIAVYLYKSKEDMERDASYLDEGGSTYSNGDEIKEISWPPHPHFYKKDNIIVLYVGENEAIINNLEEIMGGQFAGYKE